MILGLGIDVVEISRVARAWERFEDRFARRILHPDELAWFMRLRSAKIQYLASRFAAKEAAVKALGTGFSAGISPADIAVKNLPAGNPDVRLYNRARDRFNDLGADRIHISLMHGRETVAAVVIVESTPPDPALSKKEPR
ncbi:MAG: holo-ACP synthase [Deltaproteobacteria bacterium]|nr:holo-ACP synthase [Deltaproteobacteria bacterium]